MQSVVVIGSGPVGATAALNLLRQGKKVLMLDIGDISKDVSASYEEAKRLNLKLIGSKNQPYDFNEFNVLLGESRKWFTSKSKGGHSLVWGATWDSNISETDLEWKDALAKSKALLMNHFTDFNSIAADLKGSCICFDDILRLANDHFQTTDFEVRRSQLAVNQAACDLTGECHSGCKSNSIWSSLELLVQCEEFSDFTYKGNVFVNSVTVNKNGVIINGASDTFLAEELFLAAGPVGNALILLRSGFVDEIKLKDTQMLTIPVLGFYKKSRHLGKFGLAGLTINGKSPKGRLFHVQLYAHPETFQDRILNILPRPLRKLFGSMLKVIMPRLFIAIIYLDSAISGEIILKMKDTPVYSKVDFVQNSSDVKEIKRLLSKKLFKLQLIPAWNFEKIADVGESYHVGATESLSIRTESRLPSRS
jgi:hypothetical protein